MEPTGGLKFGKRVGYPQFHFDHSTQMLLMTVGKDEVITYPYGDLTVDTSYGHVTTADGSSRKTHHNMFGPGGLSGILSYFFDRHRRRGVRYQERGPSSIWLILPDGSDHVLATSNNAVEIREAEKELVSLGVRKCTDGYGPSDDAGPQDARA